MIGCNSLHVWAHLCDMTVCTYSRAGTSNVTRETGKRIKNQSIAKPSNDWTWQVNEHKIN